jgi:S-DNA-T family DNA segregation ATPase FtsK/SpoIIIE
MSSWIHDTAINKRLKWAADRLERVCYDLQVPVRIGSGDAVVLGDMCRFYAHPVEDTAQFRRLQHRLGMSSRSFDLSKHAYFNMNVLRGHKGTDAIKGNLALPSRAVFSVDMGNGKVIFDFSLSDIMGKPAFIPLNVSDLPSARRGWIPLGKTLESEIVLYCPDDPQHAHVLISGSTGSGKSTLANLIVGSLALAYRPDELRMFVMSDKEEDVALWAGLPHLLHPPACDYGTALSILEWTERERQTRADNGLEKGYRIVVYIGELSGFTKKDSDSNLFTDLLGNIMKRGRSERITIIASEQRPTSKDMGSATIHSQFTLILVGKMRSSQDGYFASGQGQQGVEKLPGKGAFVTNNSSLRFQAAFLASPADPSRAHSLVNYLRYKHHEPQYLTELPHVKVETREQDEIDLQDTLRKLKEEQRTAISISVLQRTMKWGYPRASRIFEKLQGMGILGERTADNRPVSIDWEAVNA